VFDYSGTGALSSYIVTEFIDGVTLKQFLSTRKTPLPEVAALIAIELGTALSHAHALGIIHRDIKPENVMVRKDGMLKLMDFGVAQILDLERMTVTGQLLGSPAYMAPELFEGKPLDVRTDVFSLGVMLYQMATGSLPFTGRNPHEVLKRIAEGRFPDPRTVNRLVADRLTRIINRALAKKPDDRYPTIDALVADLRIYVHDAGLDNAREEIRHYVIDSDGYEESVRRRIVGALAAAGRREQAAKRLARALECWNRALALDPQNHEVLKSLHKIEGRRRVYRGGVVVGAAALLGGLIWGAFKLAREDVPAPIAAAMRGNKPERPAPPRPPPLVGPKPDPKTLAQRTATAEKSGPKREGRKVPGPQAPPHSEGPRPAVTPATPRTFVLAPNPQMVEVWLDGKKKTDFDIGHNTLTVDWRGVHTVEFRNDECCERFITEFGPERPSKYVDLESDRIIGILPRKLATVTVKLVPPRDDAQIELLELGESPKPFRVAAVNHGDPVQIPFAAKGELQKQMQVSVYVGDKLMKRQNFWVRAGGKMDVRVPLSE
jgi:serine/threonine-protein kinase